MTLQEITNKLATIKKGKFTKVHYQKVDGAYTKDTHTIVRFVEYSHIKGVNAKGKANPNETPITQFVVFNSNKQAYYLKMATVKKPYSQVKYYHNGVEIDKATYESVIKPKPFNTPIFSKNIKDIISIG